MYKICERFLPDEEFCGAYYPERLPQAAVEASLVILTYLYENRKGKIEGTFSSFCYVTSIMPKEFRCRRVTNLHLFGVL